MREILFRGKRVDNVEWFDYYDLHLAEDIAELRKKYIGEDTNVTTKESNGGNGTNT